MKQNKILMALLAVFAIGIASLSVMAYRGNPSVHGPNYDEDVHNPLEAAIESGDYDLWISIREENGLPMKGKMFSVITEENFGKFAEMHKAQKAGDLETANTIKAELGLGQGMMKRGSTQENKAGRFIDADNDGVCDRAGAGKQRASKGRQF